MKKEIRNIVRSKLRMLSAECKSEQSAEICRCILENDIVQSAGVIALFASLADEPDTTLLIKELSKHHTVVLPVVQGDTMDFFLYTPRSMRVGSFGILEPTHDSVAVSPCDIDVMLVPGVAFTLAGARLGRGKGFYDKYMSQIGFRARKIGVCFSCQLVDEIPYEEHDVFMDCVLSV